MAGSTGHSRECDRSRGDENFRELRPLTHVERTIAELYRAHAGFVERSLRRAGVPERDVADAAQDVFVVVHRRFAGFEGRASLQTWLYRIAWNVASEYRRRAYRRRELLEDAQDLGEQPAVEHALASQAEVALLLDAIDRLDADKREALICHELEEQPMIAVARRLGIPLKTAFSRLYAARRALRVELSRQGLACVQWWVVPWSNIRARLGSGARALFVPTRAFAVVAFVSLAPAAPIEVIAPEVNVVANTVGSAAVAQLDAPLATDGVAADVAIAAPKRTRGKTRRSAQVQNLQVTPAAQIQVEELTVVRTGAFELGSGPFGESPLASPPLVDPHRHPRAKLSR